MVFQQLPGHDRDIVGGGPVGGRILPIIQPGAVDEVGICHIQLLRPGVHHVHKGRFAAGNMLRHGAGTVVGRGYRDGLDHVGNGHRLSYLQIDLAPALCRRCLGCGDGVLPVDLPGIDGLHDQQHGHDLGHAGGGQGFMGIGFIEHRSRGCIHQKSALPRYIQLHRLRLPGHQPYQQHQHHHDPTCPLHNDPSQALWYSLCAAQNS